MHESLQKYQPSDCQHGDQFYKKDHSIGDLFREYGEDYIKTYNASYRQIKLIRSIRVCRTPKLGGKIITCKSCNHKTYIYFSCGNSQCPICQGLKRMQWQERLNARMLAVPYVHTVFTLPHQMNGLARKNKRQIYGLIMRSAWKTVKKLAEREENLGALPGMTFVLHTFGSDLKYHIHVHCLLTFGGMKDGEWKWPKRKKQLASYRDYCREYRRIFLKGLKKLYEEDLINYHKDYSYFEDILGNKRWVVHSEYPTSNATVISEYLSRYVCRIGISQHRLHFDNVNKKVTISFNDYKNQKPGEIAPKSTKSLPPLVAIHQILQHVLPIYFQKSRHCGLHHPNTVKKIGKSIPQKLKSNGLTVRKMFELMTIMLGYSPEVCQECGGMEFEEEMILPERCWIKPILISNKASPKVSTNITRLNSKESNFPRNTHVQKVKKGGKVARKIKKDQSSIQREINNTY